MDGIPKIPVIPQAAPPPPPQPPPPPPERPKSIRQGGNVVAANRLGDCKPVYPPLARQARVQGTVRFSAVIGIDGAVRQLKVVSGHPLLVEAARQAMLACRYRPTLLNGEPVEVVVYPMDVNFILAQ